MSVAVTPGSGLTVAADVIGSAAAPSSGQQVQWVKIDVGAAGSSVPVNVSAVANGLPVQAIDGAVVALGAMADAAAGSDAATGTLMSLFKRLLARLTVFMAQVPTNLGQTTMAGSLSTTIASNQTAYPIKLQDTVSTLQMTIGAFHNGDNQVLPSAGGAALTAGVAQIVNAGQNADRQRGTGGDNITNIGVATGTQQLAVPVTTVGPITSGAITASVATTVASGSNNAVLPQSSISVASTAGFPTSGKIAVSTTSGVAVVTYTGVSGGNTFTGCTGGTGTMATGNSVQQAQTLTVTNASGVLASVVNWALTVGQTIVIDPNLSTQDTVTILALSGTSVTCVPLKSHSSSATVTAFFYNQARDALTADGSVGQGVCLGATTLYNATTGLFYAARSAPVDAIPGTSIAAEAGVLFNGSTTTINAQAVGLYDRPRSGSLTNMQLNSAVGSQVVIGVPEQVGSANIVTGTVSPDANLAAPGSGKIYVVRSLSVNLAAASTQAPLLFQLIQDKTGTPVVLWQGTLAAVPNVSVGINLTGLSIPQTVANKALDLYVTNGTIVSGNFITCTIGASVAS